MECGRSDHETLNLLMDIETLFSGQKRLVAYLLFMGFTEYEIAGEMGLDPWRIEGIVRSLRFDEKTKRPHN